MQRSGATLTLTHVVRCLACGSEYTKPADGGTVATNPGCPECGYLGWQPVTRATPPRRFAAGLPLRPSA